MNTIHAHEYNATLNTLHCTIEQLYIQGYTRKHISKVCGVPEHALRQYMYANGWYREKPFTERDELLNAIDICGDNNYKIASKYNCSEGTVRNRKKLFNI